MAKMKTVEQMSAEELFELAKARQAEEAEAQREAAKQEIEALRQERRDMVARQRKELAALDRKINKLRGKGTGSGEAARSSRGGPNVSGAVLNLLANNKEMSTKDIQEALTADGIVANNLSQTLAYLKRQGKVSSPARSVYTIV